MKRLIIVLLIVNAPFLTFGEDGEGPGGFPSKKWGIGFGNSTLFTGIRFNWADKDTERLNGILFNFWQTKQMEGTGVANGVNLGIPISTGNAKKNGVNVGILGMAAADRMTGINIGGAGVAAGDRLSGLNLGGLGLGAGGSVNGINIAGLGAGSGGNMNGFNFAVLGVGSGGNLSGINIGGLGAGAGGNVNGVSLGILGLGAGEDMTGFSFGGLGLGAGETMTGVNIAGIAAGAGEEIRGLNVAVVAVGSPSVKGISIASVVGGIQVAGLTIAPAYLKVGQKADKLESSQDPTSEAEVKGVAISAVNHVRGKNNGVCIGIVNMTQGGKGVQLGLINYNASNPKGLRWLPVLNVSFKQK